MEKKLKKKVFSKLNAFHRNQNGELLMEPIVKLLLITILLLNSMNLFQMVMKYQHIHYIAKEIAQTVELDGQVSDSVYTQLNKLNNSLKTEAKIEISNVQYFNNYKKTIQFREPFTVKIEDTYEMEILNPAFSPPVTIKVPIESTISGMSEVYWKD